MILVELRAPFQQPPYLPLHHELPFALNTLTVPASTTAGMLRKLQARLIAVYVAITVFGILLRRPPLFWKYMSTSLHATGYIANSFSLVLIISGPFKVEVLWLLIDKLGGTHVHRLPAPGFRIFQIGLAFFDHNSDIWPSFPSSSLSIASSSSVLGPSSRLDWTISLNDRFLALSRGLESMLVGKGVYFCC
jgi:hypothetical protein